MKYQEVDPEELKRLYAEEKSIKKVAKKIGTSHQSVVLWLRMLGVEIGPRGGGHLLEQKARENFVELYQGGKRIKEIAEITGHSKKAITSELQRQNIPIKIGRPKKND